MTTATTRKLDGERAVETRLSGLLQALADAPRLQGAPQRAGSVLSFGRSDDSDNAVHGISSSVEAPVGVAGAEDVDLAFGLSSLLRAGLD